MGVTRRISTELTIDGEAEFKKEMSAVNEELKNLKSEMKLSEAEFKGQANSVEALTEKDRILRQEVEQQAEKVRALEKAVEDSAAAYGEADKKTDGYRQSLNRAKTDLLNMQRELEDTEKYLDEANRSADGAAKSIDEFGREVKDVDTGKLKNVGGDLDGFAGALSNLEGVLVGGAVIGGVKEVSDAILEVVDSTKEYRQIMGTLEASGQQAGYTAEETAETYRQLYSVIGDNQSAATAAANLQALGLEQDHLRELTEMVVGAWARYGDSIPLDQMAESVNMAFQQAEVSGALADAIDWAGGSSEALAAKLALASDESVRQRLVMDELKRLGLDVAAEGWRAMNKDITAANETQMRMDEAMGNLGEVLSPAADKIRSFGADSIEWLTGVIQEAIKAAEKFNEWWEKIGGWKTIGFGSEENYEAMAKNQFAGQASYADAVQNAMANPGAYQFSDYGHMVINTSVQVGDEEIARATSNASRRQAHLTGSSMID